jgi:hypothetical protein
VFDPPAISPPVSIDDEPIDVDVTPPGGSECEIGGYLVRATRPDAWDAIVALLLALDADYHDSFQAVMRGCRRLSNSRPEVDGLDDLLMEPEQLLHDVALDRERRRSQQGYSTPADARAFLQMARQRPRLPSSGAPSMNPIVAAYFRAADGIPVSADRDASPPPQRALEPASTSGSAPEALHAVVDLLAEAGLVPQQPRALLEDTGPEQSRLTRIRSLMEYIGDIDDTVYVERSRELAFLANALVTGCSIQSRAFTPQEASDAVVGICNLGLEHWPARWPETESHSTATGDLGVTLPGTFLLDHDLVTAFEVGWAVLHDDVCMFVAEQLTLALTNLRCADAEIDEELQILRMALMTQREGGTPWCARDALDVIATLDVPTWVSVLGLIAECPVLPGALTAVLEGRTGAVSATAFEFISTTSQIATVREFVAQLPKLLLR